MEFSNEYFRHGSARWAQEHELRAAGLFARRGPQIGYWDGSPIFLDDDAPMITFGGAGSGKLRDLLGYVVCDTPDQSMLALDPRGELAAISRIMHAAYGEEAFHWNPQELCDLPSDSCNPLDILDLNSRSFDDDCVFIAESLLALTSQGDGRYFQQRSRDLVRALLKSHVETDGGVSLPSLFRTIVLIQTDRVRWTDRLQAMLASRFEGVRLTAGEMLTKQQDTPKEFGGIVGELYAQLGFLDNERLMAALETPNFSLKSLCRNRGAVKIFLNVPASQLSTWAPVLRLFFTVAMLYKERAPAARRVLLLVDEAGQMGPFETLLRAFSYGRGAGVRAWAIFQDIGQIVRHYGAPALQGFIGSAQMRQFVGVRDLEAARLVSEMIGSETLHYNDTLQQEGARRQANDVLRRMLDGEDPARAAYELEHFRRAAAHRSTQQRRLIDPAEILSLPEDRQILFISGRNLPPILAQKYPYYSRPEMAGRYLPNPFHPPADRVRIVDHNGPRWAEVVTEDCPPAMRRFAQHRSGRWSYVRGYRPQF